MTTLIVALPYPLPTSPSEWDYALSPDGVTLADHGSAALALLPRADELVAVVPALALSWHAVELPKAPAGRMRAALEGLLEEQLLDEPQVVHMAIAPDARPGQRTWVAVCDRAWLRAALHSLETAERPAARLVPEFAPSPADSAEPARLYAIGAPEQAWLVCADAGGVLCLPLSPGLPRDTLPTTRAAVQAEAPVAALAEQVLDTKVSVTHPAQRLVTAAQSAWELAQFDLSLSGGARRAQRLRRGAQELLRGRSWAGARWALAVLVVTQLIGLNVMAWRQRTALSAQQAEMQSLLTSSFPTLKVVVDAPVQMEREVARLRQQGGASSPRDMEAMLKTLAPLLPPGKSVSGLDYSPGQLSLSGLGLTDSELPALRERLAGLGYAVGREGDRLVMKEAQRP